MRRNIVHSSIKEGMTISVEGFRAKDGSNNASGGKVTFPDGRSVFTAGSEDRIPGVETQVDGHARRTLGPGEQLDKHGPGAARLAPGKLLRLHVHGGLEVFDVGLIFDQVDTALQLHGLGPRRWLGLENSWKERRVFDSWRLQHHVRPLRYSDREHL